MRKRVGNYLLAIIGIVLLLGCSQPQASKKLNIKEYFGFQGIEFYLTPEQVEAKLGKPKIVEDAGYDEMTGSKAICWHYEDIKIWFSDSVYRISVTSKAFPTKGGICVGDSTEKLIKTYGKPLYIGTNKFCYTVGKETGASMLFIIKDNRIVQIDMELGC